MFDQEYHLLGIAGFTFPPCQPSCGEGPRAPQAWQWLMHEWVGQALGCTGSAMSARLAQYCPLHGAAWVLGGLFDSPGYGRPP